MFTVCLLKGPSLLNHVPSTSCLHTLSHGLCVLHTSLFTLSQQATLSLSLIGLYNFFLPFLILLFFISTLINFKHLLHIRALCFVIWQYIQKQSACSEFCILNYFIYLFKIACIQCVCVCVYFTFFFPVSNSDISQTFIKTFK